MILLYIETLTTSAQHFDLNFHMTSKMMAPHFKTLCHRPFQLWELVLVKTSIRNALQVTFFNFENICRKHYFLLEAGRYFQYSLPIRLKMTDSDDKNKIRFIATVLNSQSLIFHENGEYERAELYLNRALETLKALHPPNTSLPEIADSVNKLVILYYTFYYKVITKMEHEKRDYVLQQYGLHHYTLATRYQRILKGGGGGVLVPFSSPFSFFRNPTSQCSNPIPTSRIWKKIPVLYIPPLFTSHPQNYGFCIRPNKDPKILKDLQRCSEDNRIISDSTKTFK